MARSEQGRMASAALRHPIRVRALEAMNLGWELSATLFVNEGMGRGIDELRARTYQQQQADVAYHLRELLKANSVYVSRTAQRRGATEVFYRATAAAYFPQDEGLSFSVIRGPEAPERYGYEMTFGPEMELRQVDSQSIELIYSELGIVNLSLSAVPAHDAIGTEVPTHLTVTGSHEITLVVEHRAPSPAGGGLCLSGDFRNGLARWVSEHLRAPGRTSTRTARTIRRRVRTGRRRIYRVCAGTLDAPGRRDYESGDASKGGA